MQSLCNNIDSFLNKLDVFLPRLLRYPSYKLLHEPNIITDTNCTILYGNTITFTQHILYRIIGIKKTSCCTFQNGNTEYMYKTSEKHIEFEISDEHITFVKDIIRNKNIQGRKFIFYITQVEKASRDCINSLKHLVDNCVNACFIIHFKSLGKLDNGLASRAIMYNMTFVPCQVFEVMKEFFDYQDMTEEAFLSDFTKTGYDLMSYIIMKSFNLSSSKLEDIIHKHLDTYSTEGKPLAIIQSARELSYKLYHINFPIPLLSQIIIKHLSNISTIHEIVAVCSACDVLACRSKKDVLVYEQLLLNIYPLIKHGIYKKSKVANTTKKQTDAKQTEDSSINMQTTSDKQQDNPSKEQPKPLKKVVKKLNKLAVS